MKKKIVSFLLMIALIVTMIPATTVKVSAATPKMVSESTVNSRLDQLGSLKGKYFTTDGYKASEWTSDKTNVWSVLKSNSTVRSLNKKYKGGYRPDSLSYLPTHYQGRYEISNNAEQCAGFANYAMWFLFADDCNDKVQSKLKYKNTDYNYENLKDKLKPGDIIGVEKNNSNIQSQHSAVVIKVTSSGVRVIESNIRNLDSDEERGMNRVNVNTWGWKSFDKISVVRATNYGVSWVNSLSITNKSDTGKPYLEWGKRTNAAKYKVYRKKASASSYSLIKTTTNCYYTDTSAVAGTYYKYYIKAVNSSGNTLQSTYEKDRTCDLARPVITTGCRASDGKPTVTWDKVYNADRYYVYRATSKNGTYSKMYSTTGNSYVNTSATAGKYYYYKVKAIYDDNSGANSAYSAVDYRMCDLARPVISVSGRASDGKPVITWNKVSNASYYEVYRATSKNSSYSRLGTSNTLKFTNTSAVAGNTYYYKVKAIYSSNSAANSAYSSPVGMSVKGAIGLVSKSTYQEKYSDSSKYTATPYYRYKTRTRSTTTSTSYPLSGWTLYDEKSATSYGSWTAAKPSGSYQFTSTYYYYAYTCDCHYGYWKNNKSTWVCSKCGTKQKNLLRVYSSNNPANQFTKDTDGSYFTPKTISKSSPGKFGTIYRISYNGSGISSFSSNKSTSFLWPSSVLKETLYRPVTTKYTYYYEKYGSWSDWSDWTSTYKANSDTNQRDTEVKYYITRK